MTTEETLEIVNSSIVMNEHFRQDRVYSTPFFIVFSHILIPKSFIHEIKYNVITAVHYELSYE